MGVLDIDRREGEDKTCSDREAAVGAASAFSLEIKDKAPYQRRQEKSSRICDSSDWGVLNPQGCSSNTFTLAW